MTAKAIKFGMLSFLIAAAIGNSELRPEEVSPSEPQVKAAFVYNFAKFVEWPAEAFQSETAPVVIGVVGESPMGPELERSIKGKNVNGRALEIRQIRSLGELKNCQMVFICSSEKKRLPEILKAVGDASVLTVGEMDNFTEAGGMINLVREGNKVRFEINDNAARRVRLKISSKLLSLARKKGGA